MQKIMLWGGELTLYRFLRERFNVTWISENKEADFNIYDFFRVSKETPALEGIDPKVLWRVTECISVNYRDVSASFLRHYKQSSGYGQIETIIDHVAIRMAKFVEDINAVVFLNIPHEGSDYILYLYAKSVGLKIIIGYQSLFPGMSFLLQDFKPSFRYYCSAEKNYPRDKMEITTWYMSVQRRPVEVLKDFIKSPIRNWSYALNWTVLSPKLKSLPDTYVVFYMHLQPELTTSSLAGIFNNQALCVQVLRSILPDNVTLLVKENPKQTFVGRTKEQVSWIRSLPNTIYFKESSYSNSVIMQGSELIATVTGTVGWEALNQKKKVIIFGSTWYEDIPGVYKLGLSDLENREVYKKIMRSAPDSTEPFSIISDRLCNFIVDKSYSRVIEGFDEIGNDKRLSDMISEILLGSSFE